MSAEYMHGIGWNVVDLSNYNRGLSYPDVRERARGIVSLRVHMCKNEGAGKPRRGLFPPGIGVLFPELIGWISDAYLASKNGGLIPGRVQEVRGWMALHQRKRINLLLTCLLNPRNCQFVYWWAWKWFVDSGWIDTCSHDCLQCYRHIGKAVKTLTLKYAKLKPNRSKNDHVLTGLIPLSLQRYQH